MRDQFLFSIIKILILQNWGIVGISAARKCDALQQNSPDIFWMTQACATEIRTFNLQIQQMDLKSSQQTNVSNLHNNSINGYYQLKDDKRSIYF